MKTLLLVLCAAAAATAQTVQIGAPRYYPATGVTVNDASSCGRFTSSPQNFEYTVTVSTINQFTWSKNGGTVNGPFFIRGSNICQQLADGVGIKWAGPFGHVIGDVWQISATVYGQGSMQIEVPEQAAQVPAETVNGAVLGTQSWRSNARGNPVYLNSPDAYFSQLSDTDSSACEGGLDPCASPIVRIDGQQNNPVTTSSQIGILIALRGNHTSSNPTSIWGDTSIGIGASVYDTPGYATTQSNLFAANWNVGTYSPPAALKPFGVNRSIDDEEDDAVNQSGLDGVFPFESDGNGSSLLGTEIYGETINGFGNANLSVGLSISPGQVQYGWRHGQDIVARQIGSLYYEYAGQSPEMAIDIVTRGPWGIVCGAGSIVPSMTSGPAFFPTDGCLLNDVQIPATTTEVQNEAGTPNGSYQITVAHAGVQYGGMAPIVKDAATGRILLRVYYSQPLPGEYSVTEGNSGGGVFQFNNITPVVSAVYNSGGTFVGAAGTNCDVAFLGAGYGGFGVLTLTGTDTVTPGTALTGIIGGYWPSPPTTADMNPGTATTCGGTINVTTTLASGDTAPKTITYSYYSQSGFPGGNSGEVIWRSQATDYSLHDWGIQADLNQRFQFLYDGVAKLEYNTPVDQFLIPGGDLVVIQDSGGAHGTIYFGGTAGGGYTALISSATGATNAFWTFPALSDTVAGEGWSALQYAPKCTSCFTGTATVRNAAGTGMSTFTISNGFVTGYTP